MNRSIRSIVVVALVGALVLVGAAPVAAKGPTDVTIVSHMTFNPNDFNTGTFVASGRRGRPGPDLRVRHGRRHAAHLCGLPERPGRPDPGPQDVHLPRRRALHQDPGPPRLCDLDRDVQLGCPGRDRRLRRCERQRPGLDGRRRLGSPDRQHQHVPGLPPALSPPRGRVGPPGRPASPCRGTNPPWFSSSAGAGVSPRISARSRRRSVRAATTPSSCTRSGRTRSSASTSCRSTSTRTTRTSPARSATPGVQLSLGQIGAADRMRVSTKQFRQRRLDEPTYRAAVERFWASLGIAPSGNQVLHAAPTIPPPATPGTTVRRARVGGGRDRGQARGPREAARRRHPLRRGVRDGQTAGPRGLNPAAAAGRAYSQHVNQPSGGHAWRRRPISPRTSGTRSSGA